MNKKLGRLLRPNLGIFFAVLLLFAVAAACMQNFLLAIITLAATALGLLGYMSWYRYRRTELQKCRSHS